MPSRASGRGTGKARASLSQAALRLQPDARLVRLVKEGDETAFDALVDRYRAPLVQYCSRLVDAARADDVVQQTFLKLLDKLEQDAGDAQAGDAFRLKPWLYRVAHNGAIDALRRASYFAPLEAGSEQQFDNLEHLERRQSVHSMLDQIRDLPERQRAALLLREIEGQSFEDIASELDSTVEGVHQLIWRARRKLRNGIGLLLPLPLLRWLSSVNATGQATDATAIAGGSTAVVKAGAVLLAAGAVLAGTAGIQKSSDGNEPGSRAKNETESSAAAARAKSSGTRSAVKHSGRRSHSGGSRQLAALAPTRRGGSGPGSSPVEQRRPTHRPSSDGTSTGESTSTPGSVPTTSGGTVGQPVAITAKVSSLSSGDLVLQSVSGDGGAWRVSTPNNSLVVQETGGARLSAGTGCSSLSDSEVSCDMPTYMHVYGSEGDDKIVIADDVTGNVNVETGAGNDQITVEATGNIHSLKGGAGNDTIKIGGKGSAWVLGGDGNDTLVSTSSDAMMLLGEAGNDRLTGGSGPDGLMGADGDDVLKGGAGEDQMFPGSGKNHIFAGDGTQDIIGCTGNPSVTLFDSYDPGLDSLSAYCSP